MYVKPKSHFQKRPTVYGFETKNEIFRSAVDQPLFFRFPTHFLSAAKVVSVRPSYLFLHRWVMSMLKQSLNTPSGNLQSLSDHVCCRSVDNKVLSSSKMSANRPDGRPNFNWGSNVLLGNFHSFTDWQTSGVVSSITRKDHLYITKDLTYKLAVYGLP